MPLENEAIVEEVKKEISELTGNYKKQYDELRSSVTAMQSAIDKHGDSGDAAFKSRIDKLATDASVRQEELDKSKQALEASEKAVQERMDKIEVSLKRGGKHGSDKDLAKLETEAKAFYVSLVGAHSGNKTKGVVDQEAYTSYKKAFDRYLRTAENNLMDPQELRDLQVSIDPNGGYTVTPEMSSTIIQRLFESDPMRELASIESITTDALEWLVDWDEAGAEWESETILNDKTDHPKFRKKRIQTHYLSARVHASQQLIEDSGINIEQWLAAHTARKFARTEGAAFINGDGIGKSRGFLTYDNGTDYGEIEQIALGAGATLTADGFISLKYSMIEQFINGGTFLMNRSTVEAAMKLKDGAGNYLWKPSLAVDGPSTILSTPVRMSTNMPEIAANTLSVAYANFKDAYTIVDRLGISIQRDPFTQKPMIEFYTRKRVGGDVTNFQAIKLGKISV